MKENLTRIAQSLTQQNLGALPLPLGERVGVGGFGR
jgi:hypothetical protein